jgi:5-methylthioadenosine/S-adenosylhomocysteine deaminase
MTDAEKTRQMHDLAGWKTMVLRSLVARGCAATLLLVMASCSTTDAPPREVPSAPAKSATPAAAPPTAPPAAPAAVPPLASYLLKGKVVTLNDAGDVFPSARVWVLNGAIAALIKEGDALPAAAATVPTIETEGVIYPGLIDLHNHPEYAHYPLLPIPRAYRDRYEWRWYDDDYNRRITFPQQVMANAEFYDLGVEIGRYGEYKALAGGTTSLQGGRVAQAYAREECLVRNIETSNVGARLAFSRVDIGRDATEWARIKEEFDKGILVVHLAEGPSRRMEDEFRYIKQSGLLGPNLIAIHGVALTEPQLKEMAAVKANLVWSPLSNFLLYAKTANIDAARRAGVSISLAPDWTPSGSKSILGELKAADLVNKNQLKMPFTDRELVEMVTRRPAEAMNWQGKLGQIAVGALADFVIVDPRRDDVYRNLIDAVESHIRLVIVRGEPLYGDAPLLLNARKAAKFEVGDVEVVSSLGGTREKALMPNCASTLLPKMSFKETAARLQEGLQFDAAYTAKRVSLEKITRELLLCGEAKPSDPPTASDAARMLNCRFGLPFEETKLSPLLTEDDEDFFTRLTANPNLPTYMQGLRGYYR